MKHMAAWVALNARETIFAAGLLLLSGGVALWSVPAALIVSGALLVWLAIPPSRPKE
jgi:hypothetical protein